MRNGQKIRSNAMALSKRQWAAICECASSFSHFIFIKFVIKIDNIHYQKDIRMLFNFHLQISLHGSLIGIH
jgi:hypothetical protein